MTISRSSQSHIATYPHKRQRDHLRAYSITLLRKSQYIGVKNGKQKQKNFNRDYGNQNGRFGAFEPLRYVFVLCIYNHFGYCVLSVQVESGTQDGELKNKKYYICSKKIYSKRFSTDCFSDYFAKKAIRSSVGLDDLAEYKDVKASFDELKQQNTCFINDLVYKQEKDRKE
ncbi:MAG: hypothetical protein J6Q85_03455 [Clostridia bacterium]|nr:hypothetical protein [Clostridia bacterium]